MTNMVNSGDVYGRAGDWLIGTAKRHPEALLVLAAGCALLMRGRGESSQSRNESAGSDGRWQGSRAPEKASGTVSDLKDRVTSVASSVSDYAGGVGRTISSKRRRSPVRLSRRCKPVLAISCGNSRWRWWFLGWPPVRPLQRFFRRQKWKSGHWHRRAMR